MTKIAMDRDPHLSRIAMHVVAIAAATLCWWMLSDFAAALLASLVVFLLVNAVAHLAFGPMPTGKDIRQDIAAMLRDRDRGQ